MGYPAHMGLTAMLVRSKKEALLVKVTDLRNTSDAADLGHIALSLCASVTRMEKKLSFFQLDCHL